MKLKVLSLRTVMVRFSTTLCPSDEPPPAKRLKTSDQQEEQGNEKDLLHLHRLLPKCRAPSCSSTTTCSSDDERGDGGGGSSSGGAGSFGDLQASFDLDVLDCSICMEVLSPPIYQCCNGHYTCHDCTSKMKSRCPSCAEPAGKIRNLGLEKILESLKIRCKFWGQGCSEFALPYRLKKIHEQKCIFSPRDCPIDDCKFSGCLDSFSSHFERCHSIKTMPFCFDSWFSALLSLDDKYVLLRGGNDYYLLQVHEECGGKLLYVSYVLPPDFVDGHRYQMEVKAGRKCLTLASVVQSLHRGKPNLRVVEFLLVPRCFLGKDGFKVEISIKSPLEGVTEAQ